MLESKLQPALCHNVNAHWRTDIRQFQKRHTLTISAVMRTPFAMPDFTVQNILKTVENTPRNACSTV
jgi:hypothetical protein